MVSSKLIAATVLSAAGSAYAQDVYDTFTVNCQPLTVQRRDPIVSPGAHLSDHVHAVIGGTNFFAGTTPANALTSTATTCDKELDHSIYWVPQLYHITPDNRYEMVKFEGSAVYYQNRACDYQPGRTTCPSFKTNFARPFPEGLQMVAGNPMKRTFDQSDIEQRAVNHLCLLRGGGSVQTSSLPLEQCLYIRSQVTLPSCWNGRDLDSPNHKSHMSYPDPRYGDYNGGVCPESHPIALITIFYEFFFNTAKYNDRNFVFAQGDKTGYGFHGDFVNGWTDLRRLGDAHRTCTGRGGIDAPGCSLNVGANGTPGTALPRSPEKPAPAEDIGLNGAVLAQLPGGKIPFGETPMRAKRSRVMAEEYQ
ncbi:hypothetical protein DL764_004611 [Monosporascus ibericus]|uniref:DUF1996 domain-containing protein n=1 Tax=Monosporascus ibericus TaxID=155417 RepID=A0A4Q4TC05_9PEZI|nr:hypothetical protein DL764_004611 [Monosporascus ibericus]